MSIRDCWPIAALLLVACGPTEQQKAQLAEQRRIECLDKLCEGYGPPKHDLLKEVSFKLNGQWFIGPREYGGHEGSLAFPVAQQDAGQERAQRQDGAGVRSELCRCRQQLL